MEKKTLLIEQSDFSFHVEREAEGLKEALEIKEAGNVIIVKHVPCTILGKKNLNGRIYPAPMMRKSLNDARTQIESRSLICQAHDHPEGTYVKPIEASHLVVDAYIEDVPNVGPVLFNDWEILPTSHGRDLAALIEADVSLGTSIRGLGNMNGSVVDGYEFLGTDVVGNPSSGTFTGMFNPAKATKMTREEMREAYENVDIKVNGEDLDKVVNNATETSAADNEDQSEDTNEDSMKENTPSEIYDEIRKVSEEIYVDLVNGDKFVDPEGSTLKDIALQVADRLGMSPEEVEPQVNMALSQLHGANWYNDLVLLTGSNEKDMNDEFSNQDVLNPVTSEMSGEELIDNQQIQATTLGESNMATVDLSDLPELKQLQKGGDATAIHQSPDEIDRPLEAITAEETPNKGALKTGPNPTVGEAPSQEDIKKIKYQAYDTNNILARERVKMESRCTELAQMLAESRRNLAEKAEKYNEAQNVVKSLVEQLSVYNTAFGNKTPDEIKGEYEKQIADLKEANAKEYAVRKEKASAYVKSLVTESSEKVKKIAEDYNDKLSMKESEIADLNKKLEEATNETKVAKAEAYADKIRMEEESKEAQKAKYLEAAEKASKLNEKLVETSAKMINIALNESVKAQKELKAEIEKQKELFEKVQSLFDISCAINEALSEAAMKECDGQCAKRRKETPARRMRGHR